MDAPESEDEVGESAIMEVGAVGFSPPTFGQSKAKDFMCTIPSLDIFAAPSLHLNRLQCHLLI